ncbi:MAG: type I-E CRISPR-associated protein Cas5/CasD [Acidobacteriota bacterium]|nr:type I-E CRISPR-associated protein Cas5/CasD [Acidobacteriota bacterium]
MGILLLRLSGPLQSWGGSARFTVRSTEREPTKSGVIGLLAAAMGRPRDASVADLAALDMGVRIDQPGRLVRDFQTEKSLDGRIVMPLSQRYYLSDAKFLVALGGSDKLLACAHDALLRPQWPLYLGRRSCPIDLPIVLADTGESYTDVRNALGCIPWLASEWFKERCAQRGSGFPDLEVVCDALEGEPAEERMDVPLSFGRIRRYAPRRVFRGWVANPDTPDDGGARVCDDESHSGVFATSLGAHDPMSFL